MQRDFFNMQQLRAWCFSIGVGLVLSLLVRAFVFPIYQVPAHALLKQGDCVVVNKLDRKHFQRGQLIVFRKTPNEILSASDSNVMSSLPPAANAVYAPIATPS